MTEAAPKSKKGLIIFIILFLIGVGLGLYFYFRKKPETKPAGSSEADKKSPPAAQTSPATPDLDVTVDPFKSKPQILNKEVIEAIPLAEVNNIDQTSIKEAGFGIA